jgi:cell division protein FtsI (penicillin-binding protein 3)
MQSFNVKPPVNQKRRINIFLVCFALFFLVIAARLTTIQIIDSEKYKLAAKKQYETKVTLYPSRGLIFDRNMNLLVSNSYMVSIAADPNMVEDPEKLSVMLGEKFRKPKEEYLTKLTSKNTSFIYLERKVAPENVQGLDTLNIDGLIILKEPTRVYNYGSLASQLLGFTNNENKGQTGIELALNKELAGKEGYMIMQKDGRGNKKPAVDYPKKEPVKGNNLVLTLDINIQRIAEEELASGVRTFNADNGKVVIMSVKTGEILGMSSYPTFDPNNIQSHDTAGMKNAVITDIFEPGSTFKLITAAGSLEEKTESVNSIISTEGGSFTVNGTTVKDEHGAASMTFQETIEQSSNIGMMKVARKLGKERLYKYARDFGIGIYSGIDLPGENKGYLKRPIDFSGESLEFMSIGYQVMANTLQLASAYSSIANNGMLMKPYVIKKEMGLDGQLIFENQPTQIRQVVSQNTAKTLTALLTGVVERGTAKDAAVDGIMIAGKTGTTQRLVNGQYSSSSHTASFIGYFPAEDPVLIIAVVLDNPKSGSFYGGKVSAPVFQKIASRIIEYKGVSDYSRPELYAAGNNLSESEQSVVETSQQFIYMPNLTNVNVQDAMQILKEKNIPFEITGEDIGKVPANGFEVIVQSQSPAPYEKLILNANPKAVLHIKSTKINTKSLVKVPDVNNLSLRKAINILIAEGFNVEINGSGKVMGQNPPPGTEQAPKSKVVIYCKNEF